MFFLDDYIEEGFYLLQVDFHVKKNKNWLNYGERSNRLTSEPILSQKSPTLPGLIKHIPRKMYPYSHFTRKYKKIQFYYNRIF